jgi:hypothetical protein
MNNGCECNFSWQCLPLFIKAFGLLDRQRGRIGALRTKKRLIL